MSKSTEGLTPGSSTTMRIRAVILAVAPLVLAISFLTHPWIGNPGAADTPAAIAAEVAANPTLWLFSHLTLILGSGLLALAFICMRDYLRENNAQSEGSAWGEIGVFFAVLGSVFFAIPPAMELPHAAAFWVGADIEAIQTAMDAGLFPAVLLTGSVVFAVGAIGFAVALVRNRSLNPATAKIVAGALLLVAVTRFVPIAVVIFYVQSVAALVAFWLMAFVVWNHRQVDKTTRTRVTSSAA